MNDSQGTVALEAAGANSDEKTSSGSVEKVLISLGAAVILLSAVLWTANGPRLEKIDFSVTYLGARMVHDGHGAQLYDLAEQIKLRSQVYRNPNPLIYEHPPFEAFLFAPLAALSYKNAYLIWGSLNALIWLRLPYLLRPYAPAPRDELAYVALWFIFAPLGVALFQGQSSLILLLFYVLTFICWKKRQDVLAGAFLGLGLFKFQFVIPFTLIFLLRRKWRFMAGFAVSATVLGVLSFAAVGWQGCLSYVHLLLNIGSNPQNVSYGSAVDMPTLHGFVYAILGRVAGVKSMGIVIAAGSIFFIVFTAVQWEQAERKGNWNVDLAFSAAVVVSLMTGLHMFTHDFSPLILALLIALAHFPDRTHRALRWILRVSIALFFFPPIYFMLVAWHGMYLMFSVMAVLWWGMGEGGGSCTHCAN